MQGAPKTKGFVSADDNVVAQGDPQGFQGLNQLLGGGDIQGGWGGIAGGMVVA